MDLTNNKFLYGNIKVSAKGRNVLLLSHLSDTVKRFDKKRVSYQLEHRWLSTDPTEDGDAVCCVKGQDFTYWSMRELKENGVFDHPSLFDCFNVMG